MVAWSSPDVIDVADDGLEGFKDYVDGLVDGEILFVGLTTVDFFAVENVAEEEEVDVVEVVACNDAGEEVREVLHAMLEDGDVVGRCTTANMQIGNYENEVL